MNHHYMPAGPGQPNAPPLPHHSHPRRPPDFYPYQHLGQPQSPLHHPYAGYPPPGSYYAQSPAGPPAYPPPRWQPPYQQVHAYYHPTAPPPALQQAAPMPHYQSRSPMVVSSQPFAPSITPATRQTPGPNSLPPPAGPSPRPIPRNIEQSIIAPLAPPSPAPTPKQEQSQEQEQAVSERAATPSSQPSTRRHSSSLSIAPFYRMPAYPSLPWYSVPEADFPPRARQRRRRKQVAQEVATIFPERSDAVEEDVQGQTTDDAHSEVSTIAVPSDPETPATSRAPSERDCVQVVETTSSTQGGTPSPQIPMTQPQHVRRDTRSAIAVPNIPALARPKQFPQAIAQEEAEALKVETDTPSMASQEISVSGEEEGIPSKDVSATVPAPKSWADLVKRNAPNSSSAGLQQGTVITNASSLPKSASLADALRQYSVQADATLSFLEPRGLVNTGNMCYMNSILQVLIFCVPFYNFLDQVRQRTVHTMKSDTPLVDAMIMFMKEYRVLASAESVKVLQGLLTQQQLEQYGEPVTPEYVYDAIRKLERFISMRRGHQQDAEEFLGFLLEGLHDECVAVMAGATDLQGATESDVASLTLATSPSAGDGWFEVGPKQRAAITRTAGQQDAPSPVTKIFGGHLRSELRVPGLQPSVTLEPYKPLQLDIGAPHVNNIIDALKSLTRSEALTGDFGGKGNSAKKQVFIDSLPPVLILHLKRFQYENNLTGTQKIWKKIGYPLELEIPKELFQPSKRGSLAVNGGPPKYRLTSVVYHHGKSAAGGHYTVDVLREDGREWIRIDDTIIRRIRREDVAEGGSEEDPRILAKALEQHKADLDLQKQRNMYQGLDEAEKEPEEEKPWSEVNGHMPGHKKWGSIANTGTSTPNSGTGKRTPTVKRESVRDNKVAYILLYERMES